MKKAKRMLTFMLCFFMVMSCLTGFAVDKAIDITDEAAHAKVVYADDFSDNSAVGNQIQIENTASVDGQNVVRIENEKFVIQPVQTTSHVKFYPGIAPVDPMYIEVDIEQEDLFNRNGAVLRMPFTMLYGRWVDFRWYGGTNSEGGNGYLSVPAADGGNVTMPFEYANLNLKIKVDAAKGSYAIWANNILFVDEGMGAIQSSGGGDSIFFQVLGDTTEFTSAKLDNLKFYTVPQTVFPMEKQVDYVEANVRLSENKTYNVSANNGNAVEIDVVATSGTSGYHSILFGNTSTNTALKIDWNSAAGDNITFRPWAGGWGTEVSKAASQYGAFGSELKITVIYSEAGDEAELYVNGNFVDRYGFSGTVATANYVEIRVNGTISVRDVRVYNTLKGLKITEGENVVNVITNEEVSGNLYFAKYDENSDSSKLLTDIAVSPVVFKPGRAYTISKENWSGARAFLWDNDLKPIVDPWNLAD